LNKVYHCKKPGCEFTSGSPIGITTHVKRDHATSPRGASHLHINGVVVENLTLEQLFKQAEELKSQMNQNSLLIDRKLEQLHLKRVEPQDVELRHHLNKIDAKVWIGKK
jgi:hypothetical protein